MLPPGRTLGHYVVASQLGAGAMGAVYEATDDRLGRSVALKVIHIFEIADRELRTWMNAFIRPLEAQVNSFQEQANNRIEGMGRIRNAETDLLVRVDELNEYLAQCAAQQEAWEAHNERIARLLEVERDPSLAGPP